MREHRQHLKAETDSEWEKVIIDSQRIPHRTILQSHSVVLEKNKKSTKKLKQKKRKKYYRLKSKYISKSAKQET
jgi:hypothetical protein